MPKLPAPLPGERGSREKILDVALDLFVILGYEKTSLRQIAEQMNFTKAALYYHFSSKEEILLALHLRLHALLRDRLGGFSPDIVRRKEISVLAKSVIDLVSGNRALFRLHLHDRVALEVLHKTPSNPHGDNGEGVESRLLQAFNDPNMLLSHRVRLACVVSLLTVVPIQLSTLFPSDAEKDLSQELSGLVCDILSSLGKVTEVWI